MMPMNTMPLGRCKHCDGPEFEDRLVGGVCGWCFVDEVLATDGEVDTLLPERS